MVAAGIVERQPDPEDRRAVLLLPTAGGRDWVERRRTEVAGALADALRGMPPDDRAQLVRLVVALNDSLRAEGAERPSGALLAAR